MWQLAAWGVAAWAVWAITARALYQRWAAEDDEPGSRQLGHGVIAAMALCFALLLPVALAVVLIHARSRHPEPARLRAMAADLDAATVTLARANDDCQREIDRAQDHSDTPGGSHALPAAHRPRGQAPR